jgi:hypothetical protein
LQNSNTKPPDKNKLDGSKNEESVRKEVKRIKFLAANDSKGSSGKDHLKDLALKSKAGSEESENKEEKELEEQSLCKIHGRWSSKEHDKFVKGNCIG